MSIFLMNLLNILARASQSLINATKKLIVILLFPSTQLLVLYSINCSLHTRKNNNNNKIKYKKDESVLNVSRVNVSKASKCQEGVIPILSSTIDFYILLPSNVMQATTLHIFVQKTHMCDDYYYYEVSSTKRK